MLPEAFLFDFDGVIADTESVWFSCIVSFAERHALPVSRAALEEYIGDGDTGMMRLLAAALGSEEKLRELYPEMQTEFRQRTESLGMKAGVADYLNFACERGIALACTSSSRRNYILHWLDKLGIRERFSVVVTRDDLADDARVKPAPDLYLLTLRRLGSEASRCIAFEDSIPGLRAAAAAGVPCARIPSPVTDALPAGPAVWTLDMGHTPPETFFREYQVNIKTGGSSHADG